MTQEIEICNVSKLYSETLESLGRHTRLEQINLSDTKISQAIYFHLSKMKYAGWKHRINFGRSKKHSISDYFQDIVSFYLKASLSDEYQVLLERKIKNTQPDILIKKNNKNLFIIEVKTTIGWKRPDSKFSNELQKRIKDLSKNFCFSEENIIYVYEEHGNVGAEFSKNFWDGKKAASRPINFPLSIIYPLFNQTDPYYWNEYSGKTRQTEYPLITDDYLFNRAKNNIVTPFEEIIKTIQGADTQLI